jgi:hypothetical protein
MFLGHKVREYGDGEVWVCSWVFSRGDAFKAGGDALVEAEREIAEAMRAGRVSIPQVSSPHYGGPGAVFVKPPVVRVSRSWVVVSQRCGYDI